MRRMEVPEYLSRLAVLDAELDEIDELRSFLRSEIWQLENFHQDVCRQYIIDQKILGQKSWRCTGHSNDCTIDLKPVDDKDWKVLDELVRGASSEVDYDEFGHVDRETFKFTIDACPYPHTHYVCLQWRYTDPVEDPATKLPVYICKYRLQIHGFIKGKRAKGEQDRDDDYINAWIEKLGIIISNREQMDRKRKGLKITEIVEGVEFDA